MDYYAEAERFASKCPHVLTNYISSAFERGNLDKADAGLLHSRQVWTVVICRGEDSDTATLYLFVDRREPFWHHYATGTNLKLAKILLTIATSFRDKLHVLYTDTVDDGEIADSSASIIVNLQDYTTTRIITRN